MNCEENEIKGRVSISGSRIEALTDVLEVIIDENKYNREGVLLKEKRDDRQDIMLYLNYAVANIREVVGLKSGQSDNGLKSLNEDKLSKLADFLWTFRFDEPQFDFRKRMECERKGHEHDYRKLAPKLAMKIVELRNYFVHDNRDGNEALICDHDLYVLIEGLLRPMAEEAASGSRNRVDKLIRGHFLNLRDKDVERREDRKYDLTRKGIIFLTCLALYKDDAEEFLSCFKDMRIPNRRRDSLENLTEAAANAKFGGGKIPSKRAFHDAFTFFSYRRGRVSVGTEENIDYLHFAEIIGYLCKVPKTSHDYLALETERKLLADLSAASTESDENKLFKYDLSKQVRAREKFVSLAAAWCERFDKLPCLRFKRLDVTPSVGRHRYMYGKENDNAVRLDHHYAIVDGAIRFEWCPTSHYKEDGIKVGCLRSSIGSQEFRRILWCTLRKARDVDAALNNYFSAYHRIVEIVLNSETGELNIFANSELAGLVQVVTGKSAEVLADDVSVLDRYFPRNLWRFFFQTDMRPDEESLRYSLCGDSMNMRERILEQDGDKREWERDPKLGAIGARIRKCDDFLLRFERFSQWRVKNAKKIKEQRERFPRCAKGELLQPPRDCRITDASAVAMVIDYLQYHLPANNKLRQLQIGEQHNDGMRDHEYQMIRHAIAKFSYDNNGVLCGWNVVRRFDFRGRERAEWPGALRKLNNGNPLYRKMRRDDMIECYNNGLVKRLRPELQQPLEALKAHLDELAKKGMIEKFRGNFDLRDLAAVAAKALLEKMSAIPNDDISEATCRKFGVKRGLPLDHDSAIRTILGIDLEKWRRAFDYSTGRKFDGRRLELSEHIVSQVPLPNGFADRFVVGSSKAFSDVVEDGLVMWPKAFASLDDSKVGLQDFYDVSPLVAYVHELKKDKGAYANEFPIVTVKGVNAWASLEPQKWPPDFSRSGINKAIAQIKTAHNEDRMLLRFAFDYWAEYQKSDSFDAENSRISAVMSEKTLPTVRKFFEAKRCVRLGQLKVWISRNDVFSPDYPHIRENCSVLEGLLKVEFPDRTEFNFDEVSQCFARQQRKCRLLRKEMVRLILEFEGRKGCAIPEAAYAGLNSEKIREMEYETCYSRRYPGLSFEEYLLVVSMRNRVMHDTLLIVSDASYRRVRDLFMRCRQDYVAPPPPSSRMVFKVS